MVILLMDLKMISEIVDPVTENGYLNFRRAGVFLMQLETIDNDFFCVSLQNHFAYLLCFQLRVRSDKDSLNPELILSGFHIRADPGDRDEILAMDQLHVVLTKAGAGKSAIQLFLFRLVTTPYSGNHGSVDLNLLPMGQSLAQGDKGFLHSLRVPHGFQVSRADRM